MINDCGYALVQIQTLGYNRYKLIKRSISKICFNNWYRHDNEYLYINGDDALILINNYLERFMDKDEIICCYEWVNMTMLYVQKIINNDLSIMDFTLPFL